MKSFLRTYLLSYSRPGYGIFYCDGLDVTIKNTKGVSESVRDLQRFRKMVEIVDLEPFESDSEASNEVLAGDEGIMTNKLKTFLEQKFPNPEAEVFVLGVYNAKLGASISRETQISCTSDEFVRELLRGVRLHFLELTRVFKAGKYERPPLGSKIQENIDYDAHMVILALSHIDTVVKDINSLSMRHKKWYGAHFPELDKIIVNNNILYVQVSKFIGNKSELGEGQLDGLKEIVGNEDTAKKIIQAAKESNGQDLLGLDNVQSLAQRVMNLNEQRSNLYDYVVTYMNKIAPALTCLVGEFVGARLIARAGSLTNLAKCPSSSFQILGAEKALFR